VGTNDEIVSIGDGVGTMKVNSTSKMLLLNLFHAVRIISTGIVISLISFESSFRILARTEPAHTRDIRQGSPSQGASTMTAIQTTEMEIILS
jgi:hypothetical protein